MFRLAAEQLELTSDRTNGLTADDMKAIADYLRPLTEHAHHVCATALVSIDNTTSEHPTRDAGHGLDLQASLGHLASLFDAAIHFAYEAQAAADAITGSAS